MSHLVSNLVALAFLLGLILVERKAEIKVSKALWIPTVWMLIVGSRPVSEWMNLSVNATLTQRFSESSPVDAAVFGILTLAALYVLNTRAASVRKFLQSNYPLIVFFAYCAVSALWSDAPGIAFKRWVKAVGDILMVLVVLTDQEPAEALRRLLSRMSFVLLPLSVIFIKFFPDLGSSFDPVDKVTMYLGITDFKNELGLISMICGLGSLWMLLRAWALPGLAHRARHLAVHGLMAGMAVWLVLKADSMTSLSCLGLAGAVLIMTTRRWVAAHDGYLLALTSGAIAVALIALFMDSGGTMVSSLGRNATLTGRTQIWSAVLSQHTNALLGTGFESFWLGSRMQAVWDLSQRGIEEAHNGYLEMYLDLGWLGLLALGALIVTGYRHAVDAFRANADDGGLRLAFFTAGLIYSLTETGFRMLSPIWIVFLVAITAVPRQGMLRQPVAVFALGRSAERREVRILH
jgi:exopolysaccharide production protein ExoQ